MESVARVRRIIVQILLKFFHIILPVRDSFKEIAPTRPPTMLVEHFDGFLAIFLALLLAAPLLDTTDPPDAVYAPKRTISRDRLLMAKNIRTYKNIIKVVGM